MSRKEALTQFIQQIHGRPVVVKLNSGVDYRGIFFIILSPNQILKVYNFIYTYFVLVI